MSNPGCMNAGSFPYVTAHGTTPSAASTPEHAVGVLAEAPDAELIFRSASAFDRMTAQMRRAMGINAHERLAIALLWDRGPMTMSELGAGIPLSRAAVTTLVDRLEHTGYVTRGGDVNDRRRTVVRITAEGARGIEPMLGPWKVRLDALQAEIGDAGWAHVRSFLLGMHDISSTYADELADMGDEALRLFATTPSNDTGVPE